MLTLRDILRPGITGILVDGRVTDDDVKTWLSACHSTARTLKARIGDHCPFETARNFHSLPLTSHTTGPIFLLLHSILPYAGAATSDDINSSTEFLDPPLRSNDLGPRFTILPQELLTTPFTFEDWMRRALDAPALRDIRYWKPRRIGDLVFNYYD